MKRLRVPNVEDRVYNEILHAIATQEYAPGDHLIESKVAEELNISRTPVRNAFKKMIANGILEYNRGVGYRIPVLTPLDMENLFLTRSVLESQAAELAARRATKEEVGRLRELLEMEKDYYAKGLAAKYTKINESIHVGIAVLSKNAYLERFVSQSFWRAELYVFFFDRYYFREGYSEGEPLRDPAESQSCRQHERFVEAIASGSAEAAGRLMKEHVISTYETITKRVWPC